MINKQVHKKLWVKQLPRFFPGKVRKASQRAIGAELGGRADFVKILVREREGGGT